MTINEFDTLRILTRKLGIYTLEGLRLFQKLDGWRGDDLITALKNYSKELEG